ncbi:MAG: RidA family protein [Candidatus Latescibacteria bacterium]|nr:RidA family protein [Candidatus Latescibacterota bacterium]
MDKTIISTPHAPAAIGPYSQAIRFGDLVFTSGQIPLDPATGEMVSGGIEVQTRRVLDNLKGVLEAAGSSLDRVVKTTIYLQSIDDFATVNTIYAEYFSHQPPARSTVGVAKLPCNAGIEIDVIAVMG